MKRSGKKLIRLAAALAVALAALLLTGCGASLTVYDYVSGDRRINEVVLCIDAPTVKAMEATATADKNGEKYTVETYFLEFFNDNGYEIEDASRDKDGNYAARFSKSFALDANTDLYEAGTKPEYTYSTSIGPFVTNVERSAPDPFNGVRAKYDAITNPNTSATLLQRIKNGIVALNEYGERIVQLPSITEAFPYLDGADLDGLLLNYAVAGSSRMKSSGTKVSAGKGESWYVFSRYFDGVDKTNSYNYDRPSVYGWYLVAIAAGGLTVAIFVLATRRKKQKPTLLDRFPYNPEQYRDYESHLPMNR